MRVEGRWHVTGTLALLIGGLVIIPTQFTAAPAKAQDVIKVGWVGPLSPPGGYAGGALVKPAAAIQSAHLPAISAWLGATRNTSG